MKRPIWYVPVLFGRTNITEMINNLHSFKGIPWNIVLVYLRIKPIILWNIKFSRFLSSLKNLEECSLEIICNLPRYDRTRRLGLKDRFRQFRFPTLKQCLSYKWKEYKGTHLIPVKTSEFVSKDWYGYKNRCSQISRMSFLLLPSIFDR